VQEASGAAISGETRLSNLRLLLRLFRGTQRGVIVFDEADDIFRRSSPFDNSASDENAVAMNNHRASLNRLLEHSPVAMIWIMNDPQVLDAAVLRRFDAVICFDNIPRSVRLRILRERLDTQAPELARWAQVATLTPALIDRLGVVQNRAKAAGMPMSDALCRLWIRQRLPGKASRHLRTTSSAGPREMDWDIDAVNTNVDLHKLVDGIRKAGSARLLLHGLPGTGKTSCWENRMRQPNTSNERLRVSSLPSFCQW